jgi:hypothetical protein
MNRPGRPGVACPVDDPELVVVPWILTTVARDVVIPGTVIGVWTSLDQSRSYPTTCPAGALRHELKPPGRNPGDGDVRRT